jgi:hypothetical protein
MTGLFQQWRHARLVQFESLNWMICVLHAYHFPHVQSFTIPGSVSLWFGTHTLCKIHLSLRNQLEWDYCSIAAAGNSGKCCISLFTYTDWNVMLFVQQTVECVPTEQSEVARSSSTISGPYFWSVMPQNLRLYVMWKRSRMCVPRDYNTEL